MVMGSGSASGFSSGSGTDSRSGSGNLETLPYFSTLQWVPACVPAAVLERFKEGREFGCLGSGL